MHFGGLLRTCAVMSTFAVLSSAQTTCFAQEPKGIPSSVKTAQDLSNWLSSEFTYRMEFPDKWNSPLAMIASKQGDCEDFAMLAAHFLKTLGISSDLVIVKFNRLEVAHALCMWKTKDGTYNFFTNSKLKRTGETDLKKAIGRYYPDWDKIIFSGEDKNYKRVISRK